MLSSADFIHLPYTSDLTQAGIAYTSRWLAHNPAVSGEQWVRRLRRIVASEAVELAFRRYLTAREVPHRSLAATPFSNPNRFAITIGGRRVALQTCLIRHKEANRQGRDNPASLMSARAQVPSVLLTSELLADKDLYLFAFIAAAGAESRADLQRAIALSQPLCCFHLLPKTWAQPDQWAPLGQLALTSESSASFEIELGGLDENRAFLSQTLGLPPGGQVTAQQGYYTLAYLSAASLPEGRLKVFSPRLSRSFIVAPWEWRNIWVSGREIILAGYLSCGEFRRQAGHLPAGGGALPCDDPSSTHLAVSVTELHPIAGLLQSAKEWAANREHP